MFLDFVLYDGTAYSKGAIRLSTAQFNVFGSEVGPDENQKREWIRAIQGGSAPLSNFDYASVLTEAMLLGNVAIRMGKPNLA